MSSAVDISQASEKYKTKSLAYNAKGTQCIILTPCVTNVIFS